MGVNIEGLVHDLHRLDQRAKEIKEEADDLRALLKEHVTVGENFTTAEGLRVVVSPNRRFNEKKAREWLTAEDLVNVVEEKINGAKVKVLYPEEWEMSQDEFAPKIQIKEAE